MLTKAVVAALAALLAASPAAHAQAQPQPQACPPPDTSSQWYRVLRAWKKEVPGSWTDNALRSRLIDMARRDQLDREDFGSRRGDSTYVKQLIRADSLRAQELRGILDSVGLPTRAMVGAQGSDAAMLIAQHNGNLQPRVLAMAKALPPGEVSPEALALMEDRVLVSQGRPQLYGSQFSFKGQGLLVLDSVADVANLERRRAEAGLMPLADYVCMAEEGGMKVDRRSLPPGIRRP